MKLQQWIQLTGIKKTALARLMGISNQRMTRILKHGSIPHYDEMVRFYWISFGAVRPDDWYDLANVPADLKFLLEPVPRRKKYVCIDDIQIRGERERNNWKRSALDH